MKKLKNFIFKKNPLSSLNIDKARQTAYIEQKELVAEPIEGLTTIATHRIFLPFHFVARVIIDFRFQTNNIDYTLFGVDAPLTNGISIKYREREIFNMKTTADLGKYAYDVRDLADAPVAGAKNRTVHARYTFTKFGEEAIRVRDEAERLELLIQDDLSTSGNDSLTFNFQGWKM